MKLKKCEICEKPIRQKKAILVARLERELSGNAFRKVYFWHKFSQHFYHENCFLRYYFYDRVKTAFRESPTRLSASFYARKL